MNYKILFNSLRFKMICVFLSFTVPLIMLLIINNSYAMDVIKKQVAQSNKHLVSLYMQQIDRNLEEVDKYLYNLVAQNIDLLNLELSATENSQQYYLAKLRLSNMLSADINNYKTMNMFFIYSSINQDLLTTRDKNISYERQETIEEDIKKLLQDEQVHQYRVDKWYIRNVEGSYYLFHVVKTGSVYIGAWVNVENLMIPLNLIDFGQMGKAVLVTGNNEPMSHENFIYDNKINLDYGQDLYSLTGDNEKFLIVGEKSSKGNFSLIAIIPSSVILEKLPYIQKIVSTLIPIISVLFLSMYFVFLRKILLLPIDRIVKAMRKLKNGELDTRIHSYVTCNEFELMNETFNSMATQIQELKIQVYEEQINKQKAELRHLQLQINPHFFLNSLNIIYQLAQVKDFELIKEMTVCLVEYFRFMFRSNNLTFVLLEDEIKQVQNYLKIQKMRFHDFLNYTISIPDALLKYPVPPLLIQTFVENAIKHAVTMDNSVHIAICVNLDGPITNSYVKISICDTGKGFPEDILLKLQSENHSISNELEEHIGIWNVQQRLRLLYKGQAKIQFSNRPHSGASVVIYLPLKMEYEHSRKVAGNSDETFENGLY